MTALITIGLIVAAILALFLLPDRQPPSPVPPRTRRWIRRVARTAPAAAQQIDEAAIRAKLATMPGGEFWADYPGTLPEIVAAIAQSALMPLPGDDPWLTMSGELPTAMQDPEGVSPWPDDTKAYRRRIDQLGEQ